MFDVIALGNAMIDAFLFLHNANAHCHINESHELCFVSGEKIPIDKSFFLLGGDACNVAVGLTRAGLKSSLLAELGNDAFAKNIAEQLQKSGVDASFLLHSETASSFAMGINFQGERTLFTQHVTRKHQFDFSNLSTQWMYVTSLGNEWKHVYEHAYDYVSTKKVKLAFNPGTRQLEEGLDALRKLLSITNILFLNKEEAEHLVGKETDMKTLLQKLHDLGAKAIVVTDGENGSYVLANENMFHLGIITCPIVERTGAGDGFATGFLAAKIKGKDTSTAMQYGTLNAASVIGKVGAQEGLLTAEEFDQKIKEHESELGVESI